MKRAWLLLICLAMTGVEHASAQDWARKMFDVTSHDFGTVAHGATVEYAFKLNNCYEEAVHIAAVRSSCGCTTPRIVKDTLKTYEDGAIVAAFNTRAFNGHKNATITVTFDKPYYSEVQLQVTGLIRSDVSMSPGGIEFGTVDFGATAERKITVTRSGRSDWRIVDVRAGNTSLAASLRETTRSPFQTSYELTVSLKPTAPVGALKEQITLLTNDSEASEVPVDVEARVVAAVTVSPATLFVGSVPSGNKVVKQLVVQGKRPFQIVSVTCDDGSFSFQPARDARTVHLIPVTFTAGDSTGKVARKIRIKTNLDDSQPLEISAYAQVLEAAK